MYIYKGFFFLLLRLLFFPSTLQFSFAPFAWIRGSLGPNMARYYLTSGPEKFTPCRLCLYAYASLNKFMPFRTTIRGHGIAGLVLPQFL